MASVLFAGQAAHADDAPDPKDVAAIRACLQARGQGTAARESCIDTVYTPCIGPDENAKSSRAQIDCLSREQLVWDKLLNDAYRTLREGLDDQQRIKLRDMQRVWIDSRERTCAFLYDYFQGTMANPMIANCENRETARRAVFLMGFAEDIADRVKDNVK